MDETELEAIKNCTDSSCKLSYWAQFWPGEFDKANPGIYIQYILCSYCDKKLHRRNVVS